MIDPVNKEGKNPKTMTNTAKIAGETNINKDASCAFLGKASSLWLPKKICPINLTEYTKVNILPIIATIGIKKPIVFKLNKFTFVTSIILFKNFSLERKPLNGGTPAILSDVIIVIVKDIGIIVSEPPSFFTLRVTVVWSTEPVIINNAPLNGAWCIRWNTAAVNPAT